MFVQWLALTPIAPSRAAGEKRGLTLCLPTGCSPALLSIARCPEKNFFDAIKSGAGYKIYSYKKGLNRLHRLKGLGNRHKARRAIRIAAYIDCLGF